MPARRGLGPLSWKRLELPFLLYYFLHAFSPKGRRSESSTPDHHDPRRDQLARHALMMRRVFLLSAATTAYVVVSRRIGAHLGGPWIEGPLVAGSLTHPAAEAACNQLAFTRRCRVLQLPVTVPAEESDPTIRSPTSSDNRLHSQHRCAAFQRSVNSASAVDNAVVFCGLRQSTGVPA